MDWDYAGKISCFTLKSPALLDHGQLKNDPLQLSLKIQYIQSQKCNWSQILLIACSWAWLGPRTMPLSEHRKHSHSPLPRWDRGSINERFMGRWSGEHFRCNVITQLALCVYPTVSSSGGYPDLLKRVFGLIDAPIVFETRRKSSHSAVSKFYLYSGSLSLSRPKWWSTRWNLVFVPL